MPAKQNKTVPTEASVETFLAGVADETRRQDCRTVLALMKEVTGAEPTMWGASMVGFGKVHYKYASGHEGDIFVTGFSPRKQELTIYLMGGLEQQDELLRKLGKHKTGKGCLYIKRLSEVDLGVLKEMVQRSVTSLERSVPDGK